MMELSKILENMVNNTKTLKRIAYVILALTVVLDFFIPRDYVHFFWDDIPGISAVYGFISCILIIIVSKALGHYWLSRPEDYYDD
jgi:predicted tellurium resistance membrane protein TerC